MAERLKDYFFTEESVGLLANNLADVYPAFDRRRFRELVYDETWEHLELKEKMHHVTRCMRATLPQEYEEALEIIKQIAPRVEGFEVMALPDFVEMFGQDYFDLSMEALGYLNRYGSAEFAVRPFLDSDPERGMAYLRRWATDENANVRRCASEGCRPRLPWAMALPKFKQDPGPILPVLEMLKNDESEAVRRSVANNLNDISKDNPGVTLEVCERWHGKSEETDWIVKHACRGLLKTGNTRAMRLFGFGDPELVSVTAFKLDKQQPAIGDTVGMSFVLSVGGDSSQLLRLEYIVYYVKATGKLSPKVFQITEREFEPGEHGLRKKHGFKEMSTRKHYPGRHEIALIVNGVEKGRLAFELLAE